MKSSIFDFDELNKRVKELGIKPVYEGQDVIEKPVIGPCAICQTDQKPCDGSCYGCGC